MTRKKSRRHMRRAVMTAALLALLAAPEASFSDASRTGELRIAGAPIHLRAGKAAEKAPAQEARAEVKSSRHERRRGDRAGRHERARMEKRQEQPRLAALQKQERRERRHEQMQKEGGSLAAGRRTPAARPVPAAKPVPIAHPVPKPAEHEAKASAHAAAARPAAMGRPVPKPAEHEAKASVQSADAGKSPSFAGRRIDAGKSPAFAGRQIAVAEASSLKAQEAPAPAKQEAAPAAQDAPKGAAAAPGKDRAVSLEAILGEEERAPAAAGGAAPAVPAGAPVLAGAQAGVPKIMFLRPGDFAYAARFGSGAARLFQRIEDARKEALQMRELNRSIAAGRISDEDMHRWHVGAPKDGGAAQAGLLAVKGSPKLDGRTAPSASEERRAALRAQERAARASKEAPEARQEASAPEGGAEKSFEREVETMLGGALAGGNGKSKGRLEAGRSLSLSELGGSRRERILIREWKGGRPMPKRELQETLRAVTKVLTPDGKWCGDAVTALLMETAAVETDFGEIVRQRGGPAKSPWQLLNMNYSELPRYFAKRNPDLMRRADSLYDHSKPAEWNKVHNVPWTAAMCLLHYEQATGGAFMNRLGSLEERACLWKKSYNTYLGAGTVAGYKKKANLHLYR